MLGPIPCTHDIQLKIILYNSEKLKSIKLCREKLFAQTNLSIICVFSSLKPDRTASVVDIELDNKLQKDDQERMKCTIQLAPMYEYAYRKI